MGMQKIMIIGNLGGDPEMRYTQKGKPVTSFRVAVSRTWTKDGEKFEETDWFRCACWDKLAEIANTHLHKGKQVWVEGRIKASAFANKTTGEPQATLEITVNELQFLGTKGDDAERAPVAETEYPAW